MKNRLLRLKTQSMVLARPVNESDSDSRGTDDETIVANEEEILLTLICISLETTVRNKNAETAATPSNEEKDSHTLRASGANSLAIFEGNIASDMDKGHK